MSSDLVIGAISYTAVQVFTQPLDFMRVQAQVLYAGHHTANPRPLPLGRNAVSALGFSGLYAGLDSMIYRSSFYHVARASLYYSLLERKASQDKYHSVSCFSRSWFQFLAAGSMAFLATPFDLVLLRQQIDHTRAEPRGYSNFFDGAGRIMREHGTRGLFTGALANALKWGTFGGAMLQTYDYYSEFFPRVFGESVVNKPFAVATAALVGCAVSLPFDNAKTKLQANIPGTSYKGITDCFYRAIAQEGFLGLYVGYWHYVTRVSLSALLTIWMVDSLRGRIYG
jgi:hypothetical protein